MLRAFNVIVRLIDAANNKLAESAVKCTAHDPSLACTAAYVVFKQDVKGKKFPTAHCCHFIVLLDKEKK